MTEHAHEWLFCPETDEMAERFKCTGCGRYMFMIQAEAMLNEHAYLEAQVEALKDKVANAYYQGHTDGRSVEKNPNPKDIVRKGRIRIDALLTTLSAQREEADGE